MYQFESAIVVFANGEISIYMSESFSSHEEIWREHNLRDGAVCWTATRRPSR